MTRYAAAREAGIGNRPETKRKFQAIDGDLKAIDTPCADQACKRIKATNSYSPAGASYPYMAAISRNPRIGDNSRIKSIMSTQHDLHTLIIPRAKDEMKPHLLRFTAAQPLPPLNTISTCSFSGVSSNESICVSASTTSYEVVGSPEALISTSYATKNSAVCYIKRDKCETYDGRCRFANNMLREAREKARLHGLQGMSPRLAQETIEILAHGLSGY